jgi:sigma-B regulation protein RsbU (phosphoserine phosphatase)
MKILVVEDEEFLRDSFSKVLRRWGHDVVAAGDGMEAWDQFRKERFDVVISDWSMPRMDGADLCRVLRNLARDTYTYIIMLTAASGPEKVVEALDAGADDFMTKPFERNVLAARLRVAERILNLREHVVRLEGLLSICSYCKQIRRDDGTWVQVERYVQDRSELKFSHGICPGCMAQHYPSHSVAAPV